MAILMQKEAELPVSMPGDAIIDVVHTIKRDMPGSTLEVSRYDDGHYVLHILWTGFEHMRVHDRQARVRQLVKGIDSEAAQKIDGWFTCAPGEDEDKND